MFSKNSTGNVVICQILSLRKGDIMKAYRGTVGSVPKIELRGLWGVAEEGVKICDRRKRFILTGEQTFRERILHNCCGFEVRLK